MAYCGIIAVMALSFFSLIAQAPYSGERDLAGTTFLWADTLENSEPPVDDGLALDITFANVPIIETTASIETVVSDSDGQNAATKEHEDEKAPNNENEVEYAVTTENKVGNVAANETENENAPNVENVDENDTEQRCDTYEPEAGDVDTTEAAAEGLPTIEPKPDDNSIYGDSKTETVEIGEEIVGDSVTDVTHAVSYSASDEAQTDTLVAEETENGARVAGVTDAATAKPEEDVTIGAEVQVGPIDEAMTGEDTGELWASGAETETAAAEAAGFADTLSDGSYPAGKNTEDNDKNIKSNTNRL